MIVRLCEGRRRKVKILWKNLQPKHNHQYHRVILGNFFISFHRHFNLAKNCALLCLSNVESINKFYHVVFELQEPYVLIKGAFRRSYCCYGNLLS